MGFWDSLGKGRRGNDGPPPPVSRPPATTSGTAPAPAWAPTIDAAVCRACATCLDECPTGVFVLGRHERAARVARPADCRPDCDLCARRCPEEGITFPGR